MNRRSLIELYSVLSVHHWTKTENLSGTHNRGGYRGGSMGLLEPRFWQELFHFHWDFGEN